MPLWIWSKSSPANASIDPTINFAEGQSPSSLNDSTRAMMARVAEYRDDTAGGLGATGTASAYALTSNQGFTSSAAKLFQEISFICPVTNAAGVTLNLDGLGALPINGASGQPIPAGTMIANSIYTVLANNVEFLLKDFYSNPYNIPLACGMDYWGTTVPNSNFAFPIGQPISRVTYAALFALIGTTYGPGDGSTTFNLPDKTGRVSAMKEAVGTRLTIAGGGVDGGTLGSANSGNNQNVTLITGNLPAYTPSGIVSVLLNGVSTLASAVLTNFVADNAYGGGGPNVNRASGSGITATGSFSGNSQGGTSTPFKTLPPMIVCNYIMRII